MRGKKKNICTSVLLGFFAAGLLCCPVFASEQEAGTEDIRTEGSSGISNMEIYLIPKGETGKETGNFWIYTELRDENGALCADGQWTVNLDVSYMQGAEEAHDLLEYSEGTQGYIYESVTFIPGNNYEEYDLHVSVTEGESLLKEQTVNAADCVQSWPKLKSDEWKETAQRSQKLDELSYGFTFDWTDTDLFSRLFRVSVENQPQNLNIQPDAEKQIWVMQVTDSVTAIMNVILTDAVGSRQSIPYTIQVSRKALDASVMLVLGIVAVMVIALAVLLVLKRRKGDNGGPEEKRFWEEEHSNMNQTLTDLESAKDKLDEKNAELKKERDKFKNNIRNNRKLVEKFENGSGYLKILEEEPVLPEASEEEMAYQEAYERLQKYMQAKYKVYEAEWKSEETKQYFAETIRKLGDACNRTEEKIRLQKEQTAELEKKLEDARKQEEELKKVLGMYVYITVHADGEEYRISKGHTDRGFPMDEEILYRGYRAMNRNVRELIGKETGIVISAKDGKDIILKCQSSDLYLGPERITHREIPVRTKLVLEYRRQNSSSVEIEIETR